MGIFDNQINLPGTFTQVEADYSLGYDPSRFGTTDSVLIIGTAFNGPVGTPVPVYSVEHAAYIFGSAYNSATRREASLVKGVQDAWNRGCRTIYAIRVGGVEMYKDFCFKVDSPYKLRVSSMFPANIGKDCYFMYDDTKGAEQLTIFKPAERATIAEKNAGAVTSSNAILKNVLKIGTDYGMSRDDRLVDLINTFNTNNNNNVLKLTIVDSEGVDVTSSPEVYSLPIGILHPGVYFIGREENVIDEHTQVKFAVKKNDDSDPYTNMGESYYRVLEINTDINQALPIYSNSAYGAKFRELLNKVNISASSKEMWKFLETPELADRAFKKDEQDYEETALSSFEIYQRLGSGFAVTAKATRRTKKDADGKTVETTPRIAETPISDKNRVVPIIEGIYNTLEDAEIKYRVLSCANADDVIEGKLPRAKDFMKAFSNNILAVNNKVVMTPVVDEKDLTNAKKYQVKFAEVNAVSHFEHRDEVFTGKIFDVLCVADKTLDELNKAFEENSRKPFVAIGKEFLVKDGDNYTLVRSTSKGFKVMGDSIYVGKEYIAEGQFFKGELDASGEKVVFKKGTIPADGAGTDDSKYVAADGTQFEYVLGNMSDTIFVYKVEDGSLKPLGDYNTVLGTEEESSVAVYAESFPFGVNKVIVYSSLFANITLAELVEALNAHVVLSTIFHSEINEEFASEKDDILTEIIKFDSEIISEVTEDRNIKYDYNLYIPYRTTDSFTRQLAQHCAYTELKTAPAFGYIGCKRLVNTGLANVANKVNELVNTDYDLYAKNNYGHNMLDRQSLPYPIGKNVNVVFGQYSVTMDNDGYTFKSNGAAGYAGMVSNLPLDQSSTLQPIAIDDVDFYCSQNQLNQLTAAGIVTFRRSFTKGVVVTDGITMAPAESVFRRLSSSRIMGAVESLIRVASEPFIGKQNHAANRNALKTAIKSNLNKIVGTLIETFEFTMDDSASTAKMSVISIDYQIVPIYEIREIRSNIKITDSLSSSSTTQG